MLEPTTVLEALALDATTCPTVTIGACCYEDDSLGWTCLDNLALNACNFYGGVWYVNTTCATVTCPPATGEGACCYEDPDLGWTCVWTDEGESVTIISLALGIAMCPAPKSIVELATDPEGACCYPDADLGWTCVYTDPWTCDDLAGTWYSNTLCQDIQCPAG